LASDDCEVIEPGFQTKLVEKIDLDFHGAVFKKYPVYKARSKPVACLGDR